MGFVARFRIQLGLQLVVHAGGLDEGRAAATQLAAVTLTERNSRYLELTEIGQTAVEDQGVEGAEMAAVCAHLCELRPGFLHARTCSGPTSLKEAILSSGCFPGFFVVSALLYRAQSVLCFAVDEN